jgi:hypothetical protein
MSLNPQWPTNDPAHSLPGTAMKFGELGSPMVLADTGAEGLMVIDRALEAALRLPAVSAAVAVTECVPGAKTLDVIDQALAALALPEPTAVAPSNKVMREPAAAVPVNSGVVTSVILSVWEAPLSEAAARSGALGAAGAVVSIVTDRTALAGPVLPAGSMAFAVIA